MTYQELSVFGRLRKVAKCGPFSMFETLAYLLPILTCFPLFVLGRMRAGLQKANETATTTEEIRHLHFAFELGLVDVSCLEINNGKT